MRKGAIMGETKVRYKWEKEYKDREEALENATWLHEALKGNPDYKDSRILLHVDDCGKVELFEFSDSDTKVHVTEEDGHPVLEIVKF